jgi:hypothetical protein
MATTYFAIIRKEDYETFRSILGHYLPDAYDEWRRRFDDELDQITRSPGLKGRGIEVDPNEFAMWLTTHRGERTLQGLRNFAFHKRSAVEDQ